MKEYFLNIWIGLSTVAIGMKVTFKHLFVPAVTIQYPSVRVELPERERNRLYVNMDDCIGCDQCSRACPVSCIEIETVKGLPTEDLGKTSNGKKKALWVTKFDIDFAKCCYCQLCVFPCPTECIYMTDVYEFSEFQRNDLVYDFVTLTPEEREQKKLNYQKFEVEKAAEKAAKKPVTPPATPEAKPEVKVKTETPPPGADNPGENKVS
ncbi:MAG: NADPH-quinone oxidoreductase [Ignavibacteria bacterium RIFOXYB2_FULL_35_12]|nr:MAG: NADPH-quinone oxidoreductase [Ignavibacteria bacterium GWA2_36_19]OGU55755.1 MAG: NADPH-quinone oxidoreductase [Ignavibacteria bacterium GWC2_35_8]OGU57075.1 MAG: NADPH-quinone oxidoreductase [Ignavibacteria bacterium GWF2_35_20]OGU82715.1 MAG: NADPH-quinone oxidoreductase [Ignavibacteria bacterium RIFOXYA2_FULL_35_9]OGU90668.1 MAG: NADPH-quinone oxidoreductase [Ignavibacteria bacterium RIFOXYC12_FULL_35_11]OGU93689.1 MAG: NADPH-quinone oxidoreductase [Ignavibacteria bacterium RIFOXYB1